MDTFAFRRPNRYDDEANSTAYMGDGSSGEDTRTTHRDPAARTPAVAASRRPHFAPPRRTGAGRPPAAASSAPAGELLSMKRVLEMTESLQKAQETRESADADEKAHRAAREQAMRNAKWETVKARMRQRATPLHTVRAYDSDMDFSSSEDEDGLPSSRRRATETRSTTSTHTNALQALAPSLSEERALRRQPFRSVETVPQRVVHFVYNWFMFFVYALSASALPGMSASKGADSREYYDRDHNR